MERVVQRPSVNVQSFHGIMTVSQRMQTLFALMERVARTDAAVLIRGSTGTGKELVAGAIHQLSPRRSKPFRAINCATLRPELLASELFGHVRGAFTGAVADRQGLFSLAHQGTVFLDEIAEMPLDIQAQLLRVVEEKTFVPLGGTQPITVDVRMISATNKALREEVQLRRFREDLMYRIRVVPLFLPRLVDREGDVEALLWHFIDEFNVRGGRQITGIQASVMESMRDYSWPGNVRELRNVLEYAFAVGEGPVLSREDLTPEMRGEQPPDSGEPDLLALERRQLLEALRQAKGRRHEAARHLGMSRTTLWRKLREHHLL